MKILLQKLVFLAFMVIANCSFGQYWEWAKELEITGHPRQLDIDTFGNIYISSYNFNHNNNLHIHKYSAAGSLLWHKNYNQLGGVAKADISGNLYVTTSRQDTCKLTKINAIGIIQWNLFIEDTANLSMSSPYIDYDQNIWITGKTNAGTKLGNITFNNNGLFAAKISPEGKVLKTFQSEEGGEGWSIEVDGQGKAYVMGGCFKTFRLNSDFSQTCFEPYGNYFLLEFNTDLEPIWIKNFGTNFRPSYSFFRVAKDGSIFLASASSFSIQKLSPEKEEVWWASLGRGSCYDLDIGPDGYIYLSGRGTDNNLNTHFASRLAPNGAMLDTFYVSAKTTDIYGYKIATDKNGIVYFFGSFSGELNFGNTKLNSNNGHLYLAKANSQYPHPEFLYDTSAVCQAHKIRFFNRSLNYQTLEWNFEGGIPSSSTETNPVVEFPAPGLKKVSLKVNKNSHSETFEKEILLHPLPEKPEVLRDGNYLISSTPTGNSWCFEGSLIPNEKESSLLPPETGNYHAKYTDKNNCGILSEPFYFDLNLFSQNPPAEAKGFEKLFFNENSFAIINEIIPKNDNTFFALGSFAPQGTHNSFNFILELNEKLEIKNKITIPGIGQISKALLTSNSEFIIAQYNRIIGIKNGKISFSRQLFRKGSDSWVFISDIAESPNGYIIIGSVSLNQFILEVDKKGKIIWHKFINLSRFTTLNSIEKAGNDGYIISGFKTRDIKNFLLMIDLEGNVKWMKMYENLGPSFHISKVRMTQDGNFISSGVTKPVLGTSPNDIYLLKTDRNGEIIWVKSFGTANNDEILDLKIAKDGGFLISGFTNDFLTNENAYLIKTDSEGNFLWSKTFGGKGFERAYTVNELKDGSIIIGGAFEMHHPRAKAYLIKTDENGNTGCSIKMVNTREKEIITRTNPGFANPTNGEIKDSIINIDLTQLILEDSTLCNCTYQNPPNITVEDSTLYSSKTYGNQWFKNNNPLEDETGYFLSLSGNGSYFTAVMDTVGCALKSNTVKIGEITGIEELSTLNISIFPNPAGDRFTILLEDKSGSVNIEIFEYSGRKVFENKFSSGEEITIDINAFSRGIYLLKINSGEKVAKAKLMVK
ncbi:MAG: T9SS type A sorting domain-containing protein [Bacteroidetes bacterium]|nr:T9SS type A sorting domain-containing protein [Bacteroidota bacterium]HET6244901.1 T9SS type A sorting domain-containing protein [Bacteroidia bacterium]